MARDLYDVALRDFERGEASRERRQRRCKRCYNCREPIEQTRALHVAKHWICDDCIEELMERTDYDEDDYYDED